METVSGVRSSLDLGGIDTNIRVFISYKPFVFIFNNIWCILERSIPDSIFRISDEVSCTLHDGNPVVALESAIITHGMPYPVNLEYVVLNFRVIFYNNYQTYLTVLCQRIIVHSVW